MRRILAFLLTLAAVAANAQIEFTPDRKLRFAEHIIENYYVDQIDTAKVVTEAIVAMLKTLDPHSTYTSPEETKELTEPLDGNFSGIGVRFQMVEDTLYVIESIVGGPSEKMGIVPGDRILECNDSVIAGVKMKNSAIMRILRGPKGTEARLKVKRKGVDEPLEFRVIRDNIPIYSVDATYMVNDSVGYLSITRFAEETAKEVDEALDLLRKQGMRHLILDLTDNGGGYLKPSTEIAEKFLRKGDMIVYTESSKNGTSEYLSSSRGSFPESGRVVVMVNQYSASASEILSGALQDHDRAVVVGRRTFGKGLVQRPFPFPDGSMIRLTVSRYHTPSGRCIQKPYTDGDDRDYQLDIYNRWKKGEYTSADSAHLDLGEKFATLRLGRPVYGGGGIMPDEFVPIDTTAYSDYDRDLVAKGSVNKYVVAYVDTHRGEIRDAYPTVEDFIEGFTVTPELMEGLRAQGKTDGVKEDEEGYERSRQTLESVIKGLIGSDLYGQGTYPRIVNSLNPIYTKAVEIITTPAAYSSYLQPDPSRS